MLLYIGADHKGFVLKEQVKKYLARLGYQPQDMGNSQNDPDDDYVDFAAAVAKNVSAATGGEGRGIVICGSGAGVDIVANKHERVRSVLGFSTNQVFDARRDDDVNVLALPADWLKPEAAEEIVKVFLTTPFSGGERYLRRLEKISQLELEK